MLLSALHEGQSMLTHFLFVTSAIFSHANTALATPSQAVLNDFEALHDWAVDYTVFGTICEQVAKLRYEATYPAPAYRIVTGIEYRIGTQTIGELDLVVFDNANHHAIVVSEVKCRHNLPHAAHLARQQLERFQDNVTGGAALKFVMKSSPTTSIARSQFLSVESYPIVAQSGGEVAGFDVTIGLDLDEVTELRDMLMACQETGACPRP